MDLQSRRLNGKADAITVTIFRIRFRDSTSSMHKTPGSRRIIYTTHYWVENTELEEEIPDMMVVQTNDHDQTNSAVLSRVKKKEQFPKNLVVRDVELPPLSELISTHSQDVFC